MNEVIKVDHVGIRFVMANDRITSIKEYVLTFLKGKIQKKEFWALKDVSFEVKKGEVVGIIGRNGAGKSTILKIISGILTPTTGSVRAEGNIVPMLELGSGFDYDLSGRENIFLNGAILGYSKEFLESKYDEIVEFSELGDFIEIPIRNYSSGMLMRLAFSIATVVQPEILIVDEILAVGDENFQKKSKARMMELMSGGTTVLFVSHSLDQIREMCDRVVWIESGVTKMFGDAKTVCDAYNIASPEVGRSITEAGETVPAPAPGPVPEEEASGPRAFRELGCASVAEYQRYAMVRDVIEAVRTTEPGLAHYLLMECGNPDEFRTLHKYLPEEGLCYAARRIPDKMKDWDGYIETDLTNMEEVRDGEVEFALSLDVLQDLSERHYKDHIDELLRVSRRGVLISFPAQTDETAAAEKELSEYYKDLYGYSYYPFQLHEKRGLPKAETVEEILRQSGFAYVGFTHGDLETMKLLSKSMFAFEAFRAGLAEPMKDLSVFYQDEVFSGDHGENDYRQYYFIARAPQVVDAVRGRVAEVIGRGTEKWKTDLIREKAEELLERAESFRQ